MLVSRTFKNISMPRPRIESRTLRSKVEHSTTSLKKAGLYHKAVQVYDIPNLYPVISKDDYVAR